MRRTFSVCAVLATLALARLSSAVIVDATWLLNGNGNWDAAGNWDIGVVPNNNATDQYNVRIDNDTNFNVDVSLNTSPTINNLTVDAGDSLSLLNGFSLTMAGSSIANNGTIEQNSTGNVTYARTDGNVTLTGAGVWKMSNSINNLIHSLSDSADVLTNDTLHTIQGSGTLGFNLMGLNNLGLVDANQATRLDIDPSAAGVINTGTLRASSGGRLQLINGTFTNTGGFIRALDGSTVQVAGAVIVGGTLATAGSGAIKVAGVATLQDVTLETGSLLQMILGSGGVSSLMLKGIITNNGMVEQNDSGGFFGTETWIDGNVTLTGPGLWKMSNSHNNRVVSQDVLTNDTLHTIQGSGSLGINVLGLSLNNQGLVDANQTNALVIDPSADGVTNTGTMRASGGGILRLLDGTFANTGGYIRALDTSTVELWDNAVVVGGTLATAGSGAIKVNASTTVPVGPTLQDVTLDTASLLQINNAVFSTVLSIKGTITNNGTIAINSSGLFADLIAQGAMTTLLGSGTISLNGNLNSRLYGSVATNELINSSTHTIAGGGQLVANSLKLTNQGTIDANSSGNLLIVDPSADGVANTGTMRASGGGTLQLTGGTLTNTGGFLRALDASTVEFTTNAVVVGGTLATAGSGAIKVVSAVGVKLEDVTLDTASLLRINNGTNLTLKGTITNNGTIEQNATANITSALTDGNATLTGTGVWKLSNSTANQIYSPSGSANVLTNDTLHTIQGSGSLGTNVLGLNLNNQGLVDANQVIPLIIDPSTANAINTGTLRASSGSTLRLTGGTFTNTGGFIRALDGSTVELGSAAVIVGGTLATAGSGVIKATGGVATLQDVTLETGSLLQIVNSFDPILKGTITNNGTFEQNDTGSGTIVSIDGNVTLTGPGVWKMSNFTNNQIRSAVATNVLTNAPGHTIQGAGQIGVNAMGLINNGLIDNNQTSMLTIDPSTARVTNTGTLQSSGGGILRLFGGTFTNTGGFIRALDGSTVELGSAAVIVGGTLSTAGSGVIKATGGVVTLQDVTLETGSLAQIVNSFDPILKGTITNNGTVEQNDSGGGTIVTIDGDVTLTGAGVWKMSNFTGNQIRGPTTPTTYVLTNDTAHTIQGAGQIGVNTMGLINNGLIHADQTMALTIDPSAVNVVNQSTGILRGSGAAGLQLIGGTFNNQGTIEALNGSNVTYSTTAVTSNNMTGVLTGGTWRAISTGSAATITLRGSNITQIAAGTEVVLSGTEAVLRVATTSINMTLTTNAGTLKVFDGHQFTLTNTLTNTGTIAGNAIIAGNVSNTAGMVTPSSDTTAIGALTIGGTYTQGAAAQLRIDLASTASFDRLIVNQALSLAGTLNVSLLGGFAPAPGDSFDVLNWGTLVGTFASEQLPVLGGGLNWDTSQLYTAGVLSVVGSAGLAGDFNHDGKVDAADYVVWRKGLGTTYNQAHFNEWRANFGATSGLAGDFNHDGKVDAADYVVWRKGLGTTYTMSDFHVWRSQFGEMIPGAGGGAGGGANVNSSEGAVPEPAGLVLLVLGSIMGFMAKRR